MAEFSYEAFQEEEQAAMELAGKLGLEKVADLELIARIYHAQDLINPLSTTYFTGADCKRLIEWLSKGASNG